MKNKGRKARFLVILLLLFISIGYAYLNSTLNINGTSTINNPTWDIHWEAVSVKNGSVTATTPTIDSSKTTVNYSVVLINPGDYYEFTVDAVNAGTIDGMISVVSNKLNDTEITTLPSYLEYKVSYEDDIDIAPYDLLAAGTSEKYKVHVGFKKDINASDLPSTSQTLNFSFSVTYVQSDTNVVPVPHDRTVYTANVHDGNWDTLEDGTNTSAVWMGQPFPNGITTFQSPELALSALKQETGLEEESPCFLKFIISNNIVTESYVGFIITPEMVQAYPGATAGTYYLKGKKTQELVGDYWQCMNEYDMGPGLCLDPDYDTNKQILLNAFGSNNCYEHSASIQCFVLDLNAGSDMYGDAYASRDFYCNISYYGYAEYHAG